MSKAGKVPSDFFKNNARGSFRRIVGQRPKRRFYLIVCEGEETEPNYFESIRQELPKDMVKRITIQGVGRNTLSLITHVEKIIEQRRHRDLPPFYKIWIVLDRDSFPPEDFDNAILQIEQRSQMPNGGRWSAAWSNEAFELWYLLHFTDQTGGPLHRSQYASKLGRYLQHPYAKNDPNIFKELRDKTLFAIQRAERGHQLQMKQQLPFHQMNPVTTVYQLVSELLSYME